MMTATPVDSDVFRSDALANMVAHLTGPLAGGARTTPIALDADGNGSIGEAARQPLLLVSLRGDLDGRGGAVDVQVGGAAPIRLVFSPHSERGAALGIPLGALTPPVAVSVASAADLPVDLLPFIEVRLVDGVLARLLHVLGAEKSRLRRVARETAAGRRLDSARGVALDRIGAELRVPRFRAGLSWDGASGEMTALPGVEPDAPYRDRLAIYRGQARLTRRGLDNALHGRPGVPGLLSRTGYRGHLTVIEPDMELAVAIRLVSPPDDARRLDFLAYLREVFLLPVDATELPPNRLVSVAERLRARDLLTRLHARTTWPAGASVAPGLAAAIDRAARVAAALGATGQITITRAQRDGDGSRYELGLGVDTSSFSHADVEQMVAAALAGTVAADADPDARLLIARMSPVDANVDPLGAWMWRACGLRTVHRLSGGDLFLSHLPVHGAVLDVVSGPSLGLTASLRAEGDGAVDANLASALAESDDPSDPWLVVPVAQALINLVVPPAAALGLFRAAQLPTPARPADLAKMVAALGAMPLELITAIRIDAARATAILTGQPDGASALGSMITRLREAGAVSILPLTDGITVSLVVGVTDLPGHAAVFNQRRSLFHWMTAPIEQDDRIGTLERATGRTNRYSFAGPASASQVAMIIAVTPTRPTPRALHRRVDPYTIAIDVDAGQPHLSFTQYEYLMNLLERWCPLGVTLDTTRVRTDHVDLDGDGEADPLGHQLQRTFRSFRGRRPLGGRA